MSVKVYKVTETADVCRDYRVFVNGAEAELNTARVSAYPFNRRWPGHQRSKDQTELINFLSLETDEEIELKIKPEFPSTAVRIRPRGVESSAELCADGTITVRVSGACQFTVEPYGRSRALHVFVDPVSNYKIDRASDSLLYFGAGEYDVGDLYLKSGQTVFIDEGAVVYATIFGKHVENVRIIGRGILDNSKNIETELFEANVSGNDAAIDNVLRYHSINLVCCKNIEIDGITIRDSLVYNVDAMSCENLHINNIKIIGCWRYNSDGVHFSNCTDCSLTNSFVRTFDDSICVRGFANYEYSDFLNEEREEDLSFVCKNVLVKNCVVWNDWGKNLQVGTETFAKEITGVRFEDCKLIHMTSNALAMWLVDNAVIHDITFKDILIESDEHMLMMKIQDNDDHVYTDGCDVNNCGFVAGFFVSKHFEYSLIKTEEELGKISGVSIENVNFYATQRPSFAFMGDNPNSPCENVTLKNIFWNGERISRELFASRCTRNGFTSGIELVEN